ncbi:MAG: indolepyruvate ferredoxin oxidoreductase family protein [Pseudomonadota bacterium]
MDLRDAKLADRYDLDKDQVLLSGTQALVRATLMQRARDILQGKDTAGYVTGYRGSPLGGVDGTFQASKKHLDPMQVKFHPGINEDLAATALWGSQMSELKGEGKYDGVFGMWYGKGPGVDRCGDVFRHANIAGSSPNGGVVACMGDDHTGESSTTLHQSEMAMMDAQIPVLSPAGVQELLDYCMTGWALSRYSGCWVGVKCMKDTVESTAVVNGDPHRLQFVQPDFQLPEGGVNIPLFEEPWMGEVRLNDYKLPAAMAWSRANKLDRRTHGLAGAKVGIISSGKSWLDVCHALDLLGIDEATARQIGLSVYKVGMVWPLEPGELKDWAQGLDLIIAVEEKRPILENQVKEILFNATVRPRVVGWKDEDANVLFDMKKGLDPVTIAMGIGGQMELAGCATESMRHAIGGLADATRSDNTPDAATRTPWFCAGCPHNSSTVVPEGAHAYSGIGCHYMAQWMDRSTLGYTHMGGEGSNWIGEYQFSTREHVFQNLGDGTYNHSGLQSIRAALGTDANMTFKILYNDAVAMTGGQKHDNEIDALRIAHELVGMGVKKVVAVVDEKELGWVDYPPQVAVFPRKDLMKVQEEIQQIKGVTAIIYQQTCAAEKRRRRKRDLFPTPPERAFINPNVCEGCGDCGLQSNCIAILPKETPLGRKREIDQSACNRDFSCLKGFCPSFVTVEGATPKKKATKAFTVPDLPAPIVPEIGSTPYNVLVTGVGGTGVVTVGALISMAAHLEGKGAAEMQMAGLAQKGGAVAIHCRVAQKPEDISAVRISVGEADAVIGGDLVVTAGQKALALMQRGRTGMVVNGHEIITGAFTRDTDFTIPSDSLRLSVERKLGADKVKMIEANELAAEMLGDSIYSNVLLLGAAWQAGLVPLSREALRKAIELNGAGVEGNLQAFEIGRWAIADYEALSRHLTPPAEVIETLLAKILRREEHLESYQNEKLAKRYRALVDRAIEAERALGQEGFADAVAEAYFKVLAYKDEYEVARLHSETLEDALEDAFDNVGKISFHMAPPIFGRKDANGQPVKTQFGPWMFRALKIMAKMKGLRGTPLDVFGYSAERRGERQAIKDYEALAGELIDGLTQAKFGLAAEIARLPMKVRGFGHVKAANASAVAREQAALMAQFRAPEAPTAQAAE